MLNIHLLLTFLAIVFKNSQCQTVNTSLGKIRGYTKVSHNGRKFSAFEGIPYAKPPIGSRRFKAPEMVERWDEVLEALSPTECCQIDMFTLISISGQEDCLHINVYVPKEEPDPEDNLDILVHVHGGSFLYGSGHKYANPKYVMDRDVIFVTFNYRLGIFGFLSTEDNVVPGNNGLKDQVMALKWIQENIACFGGNPHSVTLTGLSAGGASVHLHYFSEMSKGLFHRGYSQSGVALNHWVLQEEPLAKAKFLANSLNCPISSTLHLVNCLREKSFEDILAKEHLFFGYWFIPVTPFSPVIETGPNAFLKKNPYHSLLEGDVEDLPWLTSNTAHEGMFPTALIVDDLERINKEWNKLAPILFDFNYTLRSDSWEITAQKIKKFYLGKKQEFTKDNPLELANIFSDRHLLIGAEMAVRLQSRVTKSPVYYYLFSYLADDNESKTVAHGDDKKYFFGYSDKDLSVNELKMKDLMLDMLVSFAREGKPTLQGISWEPVTYSELKFLNISGFESKDIKAQSIEELAPKKFWQSLKFSENENIMLSKDEL